MKKVPEENSLSNFINQEENIKLLDNTILRILHAFLTLYALTRLLKHTLIVIYILLSDLKQLTSTKQ